VQVVKDYCTIETYLAMVSDQGKKVVNRVKELRWEITSAMNENAAFLENIFLTCIKGKIGVAENGAVWVIEEDMGNRLLPFICQHLVLVLHSKDLVVNMHEAYQKIDAVNTGYGVFIAGPSKTADIEQSLVIGAHGARSLKIFIITG